MKIYCITNKINGKQYIGITTMELSRRWCSHVWSAKNAKNKCTALAAAILCYGEDAFEIKKIDETPNKEELSKKEQEWIVKLNTLAPNGYNIRTGGELGYRHSPESNEKNRQAHLGRRHSDKTKALISSLNVGEKNGFYGKKHSEEFKKMISEKNRGRLPSEAQKARQIEALRNYAQTEEGRALAKRRAEASAKAKAKPFKIKSPKGTIIEGINISKFSRENNLQQSKIRLVLKGLRTHHKGWTLP